MRCESECGGSYSVDFYLSICYLGRDIPESRKEDGAMLRFLIVLFAVLSLGALPAFAQNTPTEDMVQLQYKDLSKFGSEGSLFCIGTFVLEIRGKEFVVNTQDEYQGLLEFKSFYCEGNDFVLPEINFSQNTLLGKWTSGGGCSIDFVRKVYRDDGNKRIIYLINVVNEGTCSMMGESMNWILIPKVPSGYEVEFIVSATRQAVEPPSSR